MMTDTSLLLKAYYEALYELLQADKELLITKVEQLLTKELMPECKQQPRPLAMIAKL